MSGIVFDAITSVKKLMNFMPAISFITSALNPWFISMRKFAFFNNINGIYLDFILLKLFPHWFDARSFQPQSLLSLNLEPTFAAFYASLSNLRKFRGWKYPGWNFPGWKFPCVEVSVCGSFLGGKFRGWKYPGWNYPCWIFRGGSILAPNRRGSKSDLGVEAQESFW